MIATFRICLALLFCTRAVKIPSKVALVPIQFAIGPENKRV